MSTTNFMESFKDFIFRRRWHTIETLGFHFYDNTTQVTCNYSATFYMDGKGNRKVELDGDRVLSALVAPKNHPFYHNFIVPFVRKTGVLKNDIEAMKIIRAMAESERSLGLKQLHEYLMEHDNAQPGITEEPKSNVIQFPPKNDPTK